MGIARNLSAAEILDQVLQAGQLLAGEQRKIRNIVFMGMGEPFHNEDQLYSAMDGLLAADLFHHAPNRILVSTVGIPEAMLRCARRFPTVNLALSLHSVDPEVRESLIPLARKYSLDALRSTVQELNRIQKGPVMIEYLMIAGVNDSSQAALALRDWLSGLRVHVNLIPFNAVDEAPQWRPTDRAGREAFGRVVRYSLGSDIAAACGQLVRRENRKLAATVPQEHTHGQRASLPGSQFNP
jgi:23S rRNA (adenine2503-C2)-methyltransferase